MAGTAGMVGVAGCPGFGDDENGDEENSRDGNGGVIDITFEVEPENPETGEEVVFDASGSTGNIETYAWDFTGDGRTDATGETVTHEFQHGGEATVTLTAVNVEDDRTETSADITVDGPAELIPDFDWDPEAPAEGESVTFDATASQGDIVEYRWDFTGDGEFDEVTTDPVITHTFDEEAFHQVGLEVDGPGEQVSGSVQTRKVTIGTPIEARVETVPEVPDPGEEVTLDASGSSSAQGEIIEYRWNLTGDHGFDVATSEPTITHTFEELPSSVGLEIENSQGNTVMTDINIKILDVQIDIDPREPVAGEEVTFDASASIGNIVKYRWDFTGDGESDSVGEDPVVTHVFEDPGEYTLRLVIEDESGDIRSRSETLEIGE